MFLLHNHRATASMRDVQYEVAAALEVEKVDEIDNTNNVDDSEGAFEVDTCRYEDTKGFRACCTCQARAGGGLPSCVLATSTDAPTAADRG